MRPSWSSFIVGLLAAVISGGSWAAGGAWAQAGRCVGDCNADGTVTVNELVTGVNIALGTLQLARCPQFDAGGDGEVSVNELVAGVRSALEGCGSSTNRAPQASDVSLTADDSSPYVEKQLIGRDPDNDTITYELIADETGAGYGFAYVNPESGVLYLTLTPEFRGTIGLPYHVTDGKLFSNTATATILVQAASPSSSTGNQDIDPKVYAGYQRGYYDGDLLGAPGAAPTLPTSVDLSKDFPRPGDQGQQSSCVGWAVGYALKTYQERVEIGWSLEAPEHRFSPAYVYNQINGGRDSGSRISDALDLVVNQGVATLARMPYSDRDYRTQPDTVARQEAARYPGKSWKTANGTLEIKSALANRLPVAIGVAVFQELENLHGANSVYNTFAGAYRGGHALTIVGYDDQRYGGAFKIINSWSQNWGDQGYFWLPYTAANQTVNTPNGQTTVLKYAYVLEDRENSVVPPPDPVTPPTPSELPNLDVTDWTADYDGVPRGAGSLQYSVANTGTATAPAGANVALVLSRDANFTANDTYVVYEPIPFDLDPGESAYRDESNAIAFSFPDTLEPGEYYMAAWVDDTNAVLESNEDDNISPADGTVEIANTLPDVEVLTWYTVWDEFGTGYLIYDVINNGASAAPAGWLITLALSRNDVVGDGDEIVLFGEPANFDLEPGEDLYRDETAPATYSLYFDYAGDPVAAGEYYMALWVDPDDSLRESNEINNGSLSWGTVEIGSGLGLRSSARRLYTPAVGEPDPLSGGEAYNGKILPARSVAMRKVRISSTPQGGRRMEFADGGTPADAAPRVRREAAHRRAKLARARQQVIFPITAAKRLPEGS